VAGGVLGGFIGARIDRAHQGRAIVYVAENRSTRRPANSFDTLWVRLKAGDAIDVVDGDGRRTSGIFEEASGFGLTMSVLGQSRHVAEASVTRIDARLGDEATKGLLIGAALGGLTAFTARCTPAASGCAAAVAAEALGTQKVFTIDRKDFETYRIRRGHRQLSVRIVL